MVLSDSPSSELPPPFDFGNLQRLEKSRSGVLERRTSTEPEQASSIASALHFSLPPPRRPRDTVELRTRLSIFLPSSPQQR
jgi:hypothetical protein